MTKARSVPLTAARMFSIAGQLESMQAAANILGVSASAVSHQVAALEEWVGTPLFVRTARKIHLTPIGRALKDDLQVGFDRIEKSLARATSAANETKLRVSSLGLFNNIWLLPRLSEFEAAHPELSLEIDSKNRVMDFDQDDVDIAIRNVRHLSPGLISRKMMDLSAVPLCSPKLAEQLKTPRDLEKVTLIHLTSRRDGWAAWLTVNGLSGLKPKRNLTVDSLPAALDAAARGGGVALGLSPLVWDSPIVDQLIVPFNLPPTNAGAYYLVYRRADKSRRSIQAFAQWIVEEMRKDSRRLNRRAKLRLGQI